MLILRTFYLPKIQLLSFHNTMIIISQYILTQDVIPEICKQYLRSVSDKEKIIIL